MSSMPTPVQHATAASPTKVVSELVAGESLAGRTYVLGGGRLQMEGTPAELSSNPEFIESFLGGQRAA